MRIFIREHLKKIFKLYFCYYSILISISFFIINHNAFAESSFNKNSKFISLNKYGDYLAGSYASQIGDAVYAAKYYKNVLEVHPKNYELKIKTIKLLLIAGKVEGAKDLYNSLKDIDRTEEIIKIFGLTIDLKNNNYSSAKKKIDLVSNEGLGRFLKPILKLWIYAGLGDEKQINKLINEINVNSKFTSFNNYHKALVYDLINHPDTENVYETLIESPETRSIRAIQSYALYLKRVGKKDKSLSIVNSYLKQNSDNPIIEHARYNYFNNNTQRNIISINYGFAEVFYATAKALSEAEDFALSSIFIRLSIILRPESSVSYVLLNEILEQRGKWDLAIEPLKKIKPNTPLGEYSKIKIARNLNRLSREKDALKVLNDYLEINPESAKVYEALGDLFRSQKMWNKAVDNYNKAINKKRLINQKDWRIFYSLGISYERAKKWQEAEPNFKKALELNPDQPLVMNYLGYSWVEQGKNLNEALKMIQKAVMLRPRDGYIVDSLGWAFFRLGEFDDAVKNLERAVTLEPEDSIINEHLGDAYWKVGRFREAIFQWRRALEFGPEKAAIPKIKLRIEKGLTKI
ncbi:MAG: hypothetical protein CMM49_04555 [Rhodospirillaceae bacterium]|nr:hypothetical protein [Rhodospirillaceae bacterium]|tara:strand:- start:1117 stop:2844 length:1728 start_codon:yes stop_codon:yes gene_type:complete